MKTIKEKPKCPHCGQIMSVWVEDMFSFAGGLGWGSPYLFVCFNDDCPLYVEGWDTIRAMYGHRASVRCMCDPLTSKFEGIPVFSSMGMKGGIVDDFIPEPKPVIKDPIRIVRNKIPYRCKTCDYTGSDTYKVKFHFGLRYTELILCPKCIDMLGSKIKKKGGK